MTFVLDIMDFMIISVAGLAFLCYVIVMYQLWNKDFDAPNAPLFMRTLFLSILVPSLLIRVLIEVSNLRWLTVTLVWLTLQSLIMMIISVFSSEHDKHDIGIMMARYTVLQFCFSSCGWMIVGLRTIIKAIF